METQLIDLDALKRQLVAGVMAGGAPAALAEQAVDLAVHASEQAMAKLFEVCELADNRARLNCYSIALQLVHMRAAAQAADLSKRAGEQGIGRAADVVVDSGA